jgi:hypothetical protein
LINKPFSSAVSQIVCGYGNRRQREKTIMYIRYHFFRPFSNTLDNEGKCIPFNKKGRFKWKKQMWFRIAGNSFHVSDTIFFDHFQMYYDMRKSVYTVYISLNGMYFIGS